MTYIYVKNCHGVHFSDEYSCRTASKSSGAPPTTTVSVPHLDCQVFPCDLQLCSTSDDNEECEPQLKVQEEVFSLLSYPLLPKEEGGQIDQEDTEVENDQLKSNSGRRHEAQPEDDFIGSDSDEVCFFYEGDLTMLYFFKSNFKKHDLSIICADSSISLIFLSQNVFNVFYIF